MAKRHYSESLSASKSMRESMGMIHEDKSASCLLPTSIIQKNFPSGPCGMDNAQQLDLYSGVQRMMGKTAAEFRKEKKALNY